MKPQREVSGKVGQKSHGLIGQKPGVARSCSLRFWGFKHIAWLPLLGNTYRSLLIHLIKRSKLFDRAFYLERYGDIVQSVMSPLRHYVTIGDRERRSPMAFFDPDYYRFRAQGRAENVNTLLHYVYVGRYRRISPSTWFDVDFYITRNKDVEIRRNRRSLAFFGIR